MGISGADPGCYFHETFFHGQIWGCHWGNLDSGRPSGALCVCKDDSAVFKAGEGL